MYLEKHIQRAHQVDVSSLWQSTVSVHLGYKNITVKFASCPHRDATGALFKQGQVRAWGKNTLRSQRIYLGTRWWNWYVWYVPGAGFSHNRVITESARNCDYTHIHIHKHTHATATTTVSAFQRPEMTWCRLPPSGPKLQYRHIHTIRSPLYWILYWSAGLLSQSYILLNFEWKTFKLFINDKHCKDLLVSQSCSLIIARLAQSAVHYIVPMNNIECRKGSMWVCCQVFINMKIFPLHYIQRLVKIRQLSNKYVANQRFENRRGIITSQCKKLHFSGNLQFQWLKRLFMRGWLA